MPNATLIYNPAAGRFPAGPLLTRATRILGESGWKVRLINMETGEDLSLAAKDAIARRDDVVFIAGGDGSVGRVASALAGTSTALAVLPSGTANVWAQELGMQHLDWAHWFALEDAAHQLSEGSYRYADIGECNGESFLLWAGLGLDAEVVNSIEPRERWEKAFATAHYATLAVWNSLGWDGTDLHVRAPDVEIEGRFMIAIASNIRAYAGGLLELAPEARIDDGMLDFWLFAGTSVRDVIQHFVQIWRGTHVDAPGIVHFQASEATFEVDEALHMQFDGEPRRIHSPLKFSVRKRALRVLVPAQVEPKLFSSEGNGLRND